MGNRIVTVWLCILFPIFLTACGGGGGSDEPASASNQAPQVTVSGNSQVNELSTLTVAASASDSDGSISRFTWQQTSGPTVSITSSNEQLTVAIPAVNEDTPISFSVTVTDNQGATASASYTATIVNVNQAPSIVVQGPQISPSSNIITLSANATDVDGEVLSYNWSQTAGPSVVFSNGSSEISFTTPSVSSNTELAFTVRVTDNFGEQTSTDFSVVVSANIAPSVSISGQQTIREGVEGTLSAVAIDSDGSITNYSWSQVSGPTTSFTASGSELMFTAPEVDADSGVRFQVIVTDNDGATRLAEYDVVIENFVNVAPVITADPIANITELTEASISVIVTDTDGTVSEIAWQQQSGPTLNFVQNGQAISFTAPEVSVNSEVVLLVTATDDMGAISSLTLTFTIVHVNKAPTIDAIAFTTEFNQPRDFTVNVSDADDDELSVTFASDIGGATITTLNATRFNYQYQPAENSIAQAPFKVTVSDGVDSNEATVSVTITDTTAATVVNVSLQDNSQAVSANARISFSLSDVMKTTSLSFNENEGVCTGSVQLSADNFNSCLALSSLVLSGPEADTSEYFNGAEFTAALSESTQYKLRLTSDLVNFADTPVSAQIITTFTTGSKDLKITEVVAIRFTNDTPWFELYNGTNSDVNLVDYSVRVKSRDSADNSVAASTIFTLPNQILAAGEYVIIHSRFGDSLFYDAADQNKYIAFIGDIGSTVRPYWFLNGFIELLTSDQAQTIDFVRFGNDTTEPTSVGQWQTGAAPTILNFTGSSIKRDQSSTDTNSATDWTYSTFTTPGGVNDITCSLDEDEDGIPDCSEQPGSTFAGLPLYDWGARANQKDIFIEVDYMDSSDAGITPHRTALEKVASSFAAENIVVHFDVGDLFHQAEGVSPADHDLGGGDRVIFRQYTPYSFNQGVESLFHYKMANFDMRRKPIFHYMLMANSRNVDGSAGSSGVAEINGNDLMISLGNWGLSLDNQISTNLAYNYQAATIMHELGHNLGLDHGGNNAVNYKPNHLSIMNYLYQLRGLATIGNNEGDRYYSSRYRNNPNCGVQTADLINGPQGSPDNFVMSFSHGLGNALDEANINEANGLGYPGSTAIDYNCNLDLTETLSQDTNGDSNLSTLSDVDEWSLIELRFYTFFSGNRFGINTVQNDQSDVSQVPVQHIIEEQAPPRYLLEEIQAVRTSQGENP